jgi:hypothetical protein
MNNKSMINTVSDNENHQKIDLNDKSGLRQAIEEAVNTTQVIDIHTHLFAPEFGAMNLSGIDELLTYHYLIAEMFRYTNISPDFFWKLSKKEKADLVWKTLFVENTPLSEACLGVITILKELELDPNTKNLEELREYFRTNDTDEYINFVLEKSGVGNVVMTNDPFDDEEVKIWDSGVVNNDRFSAALRMDRLLNDWSNISAKAGWNKDLCENTVPQIKQFLEKWIDLMKPLYMAVSLPDSFDYFAEDARNLLIEKVVLPIARENDLPFALMVGVRRSVNPVLRSAGDGVGYSDNRSLEKMCQENPDVRFLATYLARENQHELCVSARKFSNLLPFGCWWFLNNPSIIAEITRERIELLGTSFIPQHSDARVLEQLIYKWKHSRKIIAQVLFESYERLHDAGRRITKQEIKRDVEKLFSGNFQNWTNLSKPESSAIING